jgi:dsDNA-binding SOS-regulon protein
VVRSPTNFYKSNDEYWKMLHTASVLVHHIVDSNLPLKSIKVNELNKVDKRKHFPLLVE